MGGEVAASILLGTSALTIALTAALLLSVLRRPRLGASEELRRVRRIGALAIAAQTVHFIEEWQAGFHHRFPELLGLSPWPAWFFVAFNVLWIGIWTMCVMWRRPSRAALFPIWFLAIASVANGIAHPSFSLAVGGYFPGLWSAPVVGAIGVMLVVALTRLTRA